VLYITAVRICCSQINYATARIMTKKLSQQSVKSAAGIIYLYSHQKNADKQTERDSKN